MWADGTPLRSAPMTGMQWLIWSLAAAGKFFAGFVVFMTGVALPLFSDEFSIGAGRKRHHRRRELVRHSGRRRRARGPVRPLRPHLDRDGHIRGVPSGAHILHQLQVRRDLPFRNWPRARLRLSDGAYDHFREHPQCQSWAADYRRLRIPGGRRAFPPRGRLSRPLGVAKNRCLALDVRRGDPSGGARHHRSASISSRAPIGCPRGARSTRPKRRRKSCWRAGRNIRAESNLRRTISNRLRALDPTRHTFRCSTRLIGAGPSSRPFHGFCRTLGATASASSLRRFWPPPWAPI